MQGPLDKNAKKLQALIKAKPVLKVSKKKKSFDENSPVFSISIAAEMIGVHQRTLRIYDDEAILCPQRSDKQRRLYSMKDIEKGRFIQYLTRDLGINIAGVRFILYFAENSSLSSVDYIPYFQQVAEQLNISPEEQLSTRSMLSKRGRKKSRTN